MRSNNVYWQKGQALVTLLVFMVVGVIITSAATIIILVNALSSGRIERGEEAYYASETGIENGILRLLRDPNYSGETLTVEGGTVVIQVTQGNPVILTATAILNNIMRKIQVQMIYNDNMLTVSSWKEIQ